MEPKLPIRNRTDVLVVGGGPSGIIAALAAAEEGLDVTLIESRSFLGGNLTIGLPVLGFLSQKGYQIIRGLPQKLIDRLTERGSASKHFTCPLHVSITYVDPEEIKNVAFEMLKEKGVNVLLYTAFTDILTENDKIKGIIIESKAGREIILSKIIIDCTGDADIAHRSGVKCQFGDHAGGVQPPTLMFSVANANIEKFRRSLTVDSQIDYIPYDYFHDNNLFVLVGLRNLIEKAKGEGILLPVDRAILITSLIKEEVWINMTRVNGTDGTDPVSLTNGEFTARHQIPEIIKFLRGYVPGFENAYVSRVAPFLGIRESRRIVGRYTLTREDILSQRKFNDAVAVASYPVDIHHPKGGDCTLEWSGDCYDIPYRCLLPEKEINLLVAGRSISTTHEALASIRVMSTCMALGEAAGRAACLAIKHNISPSQINVSELRQELISKGAFLRV